MTVGAQGPLFVAALIAVQGCGGRTSNDNPTGASERDGSTSVDATAADEGGNGVDSTDSEEAPSVGSSPQLDSAIDSPTADSFVPDSPEETSAPGSGYAFEAGEDAASACQTSADCQDNPGELDGTICVAGQCSACTSDTECLNDPAYSLTVCNLTTGHCVSSDCAQIGARCNVSGNDKGNGGDICCRPNASDPMCVMGNCCVPSDCAANLLCINNQCQAPPVCHPIANGTYYVDRYGGTDDSRSTGADNCPFRSITHTLAVASSAAPITIELVNPSNDTFVLGLGLDAEVFPIVVPAGVTITSADPLAQAGLAIAEGQIGIVLSSPNSRLSNVAIQGGDTAIAVYGGSDRATTVVDHILIQSTAKDAILVGPAPNETTSGQATLGPGLNVNAIGGTNGQAACLRLFGQASVAILGGANADNTDLSAAAYGIVVNDSAFVTIRGPTVTSSNSPADVSVTENGVAGVLISQTPGQVPPGNVNDIEGLGVGGNAGDGIRVTAGSRLKLRGSDIESDQATGITIAPNAAGLPLDDLTTIDLGGIGAASYGGNTLSNGSANLCLEFQARSGTLMAAGNVFGQTDCSMASGGALSRSSSCSDEVDIGGTGDPTAVNVSQCQ